MIEQRETITFMLLNSENIIERLPSPLTSDKPLTVKPGL